MKVLSVQVGRPRDLQWRGELVRTGIFKEPVRGPVVVRFLNLEGDEQADLTVHGGPDKAVYAYPSEHYPAWRKELPELEFPFGAFGENLTIEGIPEGEARIGDLLRIGTADFVVTQPRMPCYKLAARFDRSDMLKRLLRTGRTGFYLSVLKEGSLTAGDAIEWTRGDPGAPTIAQVAREFWRGA
jgi:MOSC domain-containing protein YiiM